MNILLISPVSSLSFLIAPIPIMSPSTTSKYMMPFGGFKHSGSGHPEAGGRMGAIDFFSRIKVVYRDFSGRLQKAQIDEELG